MAFPAPTSANPCSGRTYPGPNANHAQDHRQADCPVAPGPRSPSASAGYGKKIILSPGGGRNDYQLTHRRGGGRPVCGSAVEDAWAAGRGVGEQGGSPAL
jgi:hypothetical protein